MLPIVGLAQGVTRAGWASKWLALRAATGLSVRQQGTLLPALDDRRAWCQVSMKSAAFVRAVRAIMAQIAAEIPLPFGSHTFKTTLLSWCAKAGVDIRLRTLLGGHVMGADLSVLTYSRDELAAP
eukprot:1933646-Amphidinium_carterae.1